MACEDTRRDDESKGPAFCSLDRLSISEPARSGPLVAGLFLPLAWVAGWWLEVRLSPVVNAEGSPISAESSGGPSCSASWMARLRSCWAKLRTWMTGAVGRSGPAGRPEAQRSPARALGPVHHGDSTPSPSCPAVLRCRSQRCTGCWNAHAALAQSVGRDAT